MTKRPKVQVPVPACPTCGSRDRVPIIYGLPTSQTTERADRGQVALGGCLFGENSPRWKCQACGTEWGD